MMKSEEIPVEAVKIYQQINEQEPPPDFTAPSPTRARPETPRDFAETKEATVFIINHNVQHTPAPPSPFPYHSLGHSRIRTESLCSIKSNRDFTVANLQPRKNIRTEDQKIIDIKRESRERLSNKDLDKSQLRMFDMIYFNPQNNPMKPRELHKRDEKPIKLELKQETPPPTPVKKEAIAMPVPQLRLNANGEMVLDEQSLVVENEQQKQNRILLANTNIVYDDDLSANYGYYKRQKRTKEWLEAETVKFYRCLNTVGTYFSLMLNLFPNRSRRDLKLKFKKEERNNPGLIDKALLKHNTFDLDELQREFHEEEEERRKVAESQNNSKVKELMKRKILKKQAAKLKAQQQAKTKIEQILTEGDIAMRLVDGEAQEVKENLGMMSGLGEPVRKKRQYKKKPKVVQEIPLDPSQEVHLIDGLPLGAVKQRQPRKKAVEIVPQEGGEPPVKKQKKPRKKKEENTIELELDKEINEMIAKAFKTETAAAPTVQENQPTFKLESHQEVVNVRQSYKNESSGASSVIVQAPADVVVSFKRFVEEIFDYL